MTKNTAQTKLDIVNKMQELFAQKKLDVLENFFTEYAVYKPGTIAKIKGARTFIDYALNVVYKTVTITAKNSINTWEVNNTIIVEYDMEIKHLDTGRRDRFPCIDIYEFQGDKICEWRVYPLHPDMVTLHTV